MISAYSFRKAYFVLAGRRWGDIEIAVYGECIPFSLTNIGVAVFVPERQAGKGVSVNA